MKRSTKTVLYAGLAVVLALAVVCAVRWRCMTKSLPPEAPVVAAADAPRLSAVQERMQDPVYVAEIKALGVERQMKARAAYEIRLRMDERAAVVAAELKAETVAAPDGESAVVDAEKSQDEALRERLSSDSEWVALEAEMAAVRLDLDNIQRRVQVRIRERMHAQVPRPGGPAARTAVKPALAPATAAEPGAAPVAAQQVVMTNATETMSRMAPALPERRPVAWGETDPTPSAEDAPGGTGSTPSAEDQAPGGTGSTPSAEDQ